LVRTSDRRDYALKPPQETVLDLVSKSGREVIAIGKIHDLFAGKGLTKSIHTENNIDGLNRTIEAIKENNEGIIFTNLVEFDANWGHRRDYISYGKGLKTVDNFIPAILSSMKEGDILFFTADHGCDPTFKAHTDHTREFVPIIVYGYHVKNNHNLNLRESFSDLGATISEIFGLPVLNGRSFLEEIVK
jgi:phosphopentomutase